MSQHGPLAIESSMRPPSGTIHQKRSSSRLAPPIVPAILRQPGQPLDASTRATMETRFNHDFSQVRIHHDPPAAASAHAIEARAYTFGSHIVFGAGQYQPKRPAGRRLLAHELMHVLHHSDRDTPISGSLVLGEVYSASEDLAEATSDGFTAGAVMPAVRVIGGEPQVQRQGLGELRELEARLEEETRIGSSPVDSEFWILPPGVPSDVIPIVDDEETGVVVGFRTSGSVQFIYDLEGTLVAIEEPGLEAPLIDPIDILAGGLTGLFRGAGRSAVRGGGRAAVRGVLGGAGRRGGAAVVRAGLAAISRLARRAVSAIRGIYRAIRFRGPLNFTGTTAARMADAARRVPHHILKLAVRFGTRTPDPQGVSGAFSYTIQMFRNGQAYTLDVVIHEADQTVLHFLYQ